MLTFLTINKKLVIHQFGTIS